MQALYHFPSPASRDPATIASEAGMDRVRGCFHSLLLFDVAEEIRLEVARATLGLTGGERSPRFRLPAPEYVRFERPPIFLACDPVAIGDTRFTATVRVFDYGVISVQLAQKFETDWRGLVGMAHRWVAAPDIEARAETVARGIAAQLKYDLVKPADTWMSEDYAVIEINAATARDGSPASAQRLLEERGSELACIVRGEAMELADSEQHEILRSSLSYYPADLLLAGWNAAVVHDDEEGAAATLQILEYANTQLLEFRFFDELLSRDLAQVYRLLEKPRGITARWHLAREASRLNALRLDVMELAERTDNSLKFLGDMFYARAYRLASERIGVGDYRKLVEAKLRAAGDLYEFMTNEFHHGRAFILELAVVIILIIDLYFILREAKFV
jgi:hypothetical protein